jgi:hypothetical protein
MKNTLTLLAAAALLLLPSCHFIKVSDEALEDIKEGFYELNSKIDIGMNNSDDADQGRNILRNDVTGEFNALQCNVPFDVTYTPGECSLQMEGPEKQLSHVTVDNENGTLVIKTDGTKLGNVRHLKLRLSSPTLEKMLFNGAVDFNANAGITAENFEMVINGAGDINIDNLKTGQAALIVNGAGDVTISGLDCEKLKVELNGAGDATVSGRARLADLSISGAGDIDATGLEAEKLDTHVKGFGKVSRPKGK